MSDKFSHIYCVLVFFHNYDKIFFLHHSHHVHKLKEIHSQTPVNTRRDQPVGHLKKVVKSGKNTGV